MRQFIFVVVTVFIYLVLKAIIDSAIGFEISDSQRWAFACRDMVLIIYGVTIGSLLNTSLAKS